MRELNFSSMCHIFVIPRGLRGHSLLSGKRSTVGHAMGSRGLLYLRRQTPPRVMFDLSL